MTGAFVNVRDLHVDFPTDDGVVHAVAGVNFDVSRGETLAIVGESGSGKSVTAQAIMGLLNPNVAQVSGHVMLDGTDLLTCDADEVRTMRGSVMAMIFQDPLSSLHPFYRIGDQLIEAVRIHQNVSTAQARDLAIDGLRRVGIPAPERRIDDFPHQLSGGMRQRVMIAMALINGPELLIADEPTTALDVTVQAQIIELLMELQQQTGTTMIVITHDLGVVAEMADHVCVMYGGRVVEYGQTDDVYYRAAMPYTQGLLSSVPRLDEDRSAHLDPIPGNPPSLIRLPTGCVFHPRCRERAAVPDDLCRDREPALLPVTSGHTARCHLVSGEAVTQ